MASPKLEILTKDRIRQEIRKQIYQYQVPVNRLAKECGMDAKTVMLASEADMTERTQMRFSRYFEAKDKKLEHYRIDENHSVKPTTVSTDQLLRKIRELSEDMHDEFDTRYWNISKLKALKPDLLAIKFFEIDDMGKKLLLFKYKERIEKMHVYLWDKWDYFQWKEKLQLIKQDASAFGVSQLR